MTYMLEINEVKTILFIFFICLVTVPSYGLLVEMLN